MRAYMQARIRMRLDYVYVLGRRPTLARHSAVNTVPASYTLRIDIIAISYIVNAYKSVISRTGARHAIPCDAMRRGWQILRAGNTARKICAALHERA